MVTMVSWTDANRFARSHSAASARPDRRPRRHRRLRLREAGRRGCGRPLPLRKIAGDWGRILKGGIGAIAQRSLIATRRLNQFMNSEVARLSTR
jgi:hypothetical protein